MRAIATAFALLCIFFTSTLLSQTLKPEEIFEKYNKSIVVVYPIDFNGNSMGQGSGVVLKDKGWLITNFHVFAGAEKLIVVHGEDTLSYDGIIGVDIEKDIVLAQIVGYECETIPIGNSDNIKIGEEVYAIGSPMGLENSITKGIVSGYRQSLGDVKSSLIQIDASLSPGSSGGAIFNSNGELIGITALGLRGGNNLNFAIPINIVMNVDMGNYSDQKKLQALNYFYQGKNLYDEGENSQAVEYFGKYLEIFPNDHKAYNYRGLAYFASKKFDNALKDFNKSISISRAYAPAYNNRGETYYKMEEYEKAVKDFSMVIKLYPDNVQAYYSRGIVRLADGDNDEAVEDFEKVLKYDQSNADAYVNMGIAYYNEKDYEKALSSWKKAIKIDPSYKPRLQNIMDLADFYWQYNVK